MRHAITAFAIGLGLYASPAWAGGGELDWLAGHWCSGTDGRLVEELWLPQAGDALLGMSRSVRDARMTSFEFLRIRLEGGVARFDAQPQGAPAVAFAEAARGPGWIRFENPAHDFPQRIEYRRDGEHLQAAIAGPGPDGKPLRIAFDYARCPG